MKKLTLCPNSRCSYCRDVGGKTVCAVPGCMYDYDDMRYFWLPKLKQTIAINVVNKYYNRRETLMTFRHIYGTKVIEISRKAYMMLSGGTYD